MPTKRRGSKKPAKKPATKKPAAKKPAAKKPAPKKPAAKKPAPKKPAPKKPAPKKPAPKKPTTKKPAPKKPAAKKTLAMPKDLSTLPQVWNEAGRAYYTDFSARLEKFYAGDREVDLDVSDPRSEEMGDRVIEEVIALNASGRWKEARERFDPAYAPVFRWIKGSNRNALFPTILGPDELLVRCGSPWREDGVTYHLHGGTATPLPDIRGMNRSRGRDYLVLARSAGLEIRDARAGVAGFTQPPIASIPWPSMDIFRPRGLVSTASWTADEPPIHVEQIQISDDGMRVVVSCYRQGILLASRHAGEPPWSLLWPDVRPHFAEREEGEAPRAGDMTHVAISRDGTRLAYGCQDSEHFLSEVGPGGEPTWYATVGQLSEYPHYACFSDDGRYTALNSCHFYNGATVAFDWEGNRGKTLPGYEVSDEAPVIDGTLRVYAATWVDKPVLDALLGRPAKSEGAFVLAGSGILRLMNATGALGMVQGFGSSAGGIDFCPESRRLAIASYSGFVHLYDPYEEELPGRIDGVKPRREVARWALWENLPNGPIRW